MENQLVPYEQVEKMAIAIAKSGLFGAKTPEQALALMLVAQAEGLHPVTAARDYHIIEGRPTLKADAMLARFQAAGGTIKWISNTDQKVEAQFSHPSGGTVTIDWTIERAKTAEVYRAKTSNGYTGMWVKYPRQMLRARCVSEGIRTVCPMATSGMYVPEEIDDTIQSDVPMKQAEVVEGPKPASRLEGIVLCSEKAVAPVEKIVEATDIVPTPSPVAAAPLPVATNPNPPVIASIPSETPAKIQPGEVIPTKATGVVIGPIAEMQSKSGLKKDKSPWTKWAVRVDGAWFGTFSGTTAEKLTKAKDANAPIQIYFSTRIDGEKKYNDIEAVMEMQMPVSPVISEEDMVI